MPSPHDAHFISAFSKFTLPDGTESQLSNPRFIAISDRYVFVTDHANHRVVVLKIVDGRFEYAYSFGRRGGGISEFNGPTGIAFCPLTNRLYVCDSGNHRVLKFTVDGRYISQFGHRGVDDFGLVCPESIAVRGDEIYVVDSRNQRVKIYSRDGEVMKTIREEKGQPGYLAGPCGIAIKDDTVYIADCTSNQIVCYGPGDMMQIIPCDAVFGLAFRGDTLLASSITQSVVKSFNDGELMESWSTVLPGTEVGENRCSDYSRPCGIACDQHGDVIVADWRSNTILKFGF